MIWREGVAAWLRLKMISRSDSRGAQLLMIDCLRPISQRRFAWKWAASLASLGCADASLSLFLTLSLSLCLPLEWCWSILTAPSSPLWSEGGRSTSWSSDPPSGHHSSHWTVSISSSSAYDVFITAPHHGFSSRLLIAAPRRSIHITCIACCAPLHPLRPLPTPSMISPFRFLYRLYACIVFLPPESDCLSFSISMHFLSLIS